MERFNQQPCDTSWPIWCLALMHFDWGKITLSMRLVNAN